MGKTDRRAPPQRGDVWTIHYALYALIALNTIFAIALIYLAVAVSSNVVIVTRHMVETLDRLDVAASGISGIANNELIDQIITRTSEFTESSTLRWMQSPLFTGMVVTMMSRVGDALSGLSAIDMDVFGELMDKDLIHRSVHVLRASDRMLTQMEAKMDTAPSFEELTSILHHLHNLSESLEVVVGSFQHGGVSINLGQP